MSRILASVVALSGLYLAFAPQAHSVTFSIDGKAPNVWPAQIAFTAPCGVVMRRPDDPFYWDPPPLINFSGPNTLPPSALCATQMQTLTTAAGTPVSAIDAVNAMFTTLPDKSPVPNAVSVSGAVIGPQDPINAPTPLVETSTSGSVQFLVPISFRDTTDTKFEGRTDGLIEVAYDSRICAQLPDGAIDPATGLPMATALEPSFCILTTPAQYLDALNAGHAVKWAEVSSGASLTVYGPKDDSIPSYAQIWKQTPGFTTFGTLAIPFQTDNHSTVLRIGVRYAIGYDGQMPLAWGGWPTPPCYELSCLAPVNWAGMQTAWIFSQPFTLQVMPAALIQLHYLPTMILYQPPGNQSTANIEANTTYTQNYQIDQAATITDQLEYDQKTKSDFSFVETVGKSGDDFSVGGTGTPYNSSVTWDKSVKTSMGDNYAQSVSAVVTQGLSITNSTPNPGSAAPDVAHLTFESEPFWSDLVYVAMHPQFAVWDYPEGVKLQPLGAIGILKVSIQALSECLPRRITGVLQSGFPLLLDSYDPASNKYEQQTDRLSWQECAQLLALDPFFVSLSQARPPPMGIPLTNVVESLAPAPVQYVSSLVHSYGTTSTYTRSTKSTVTSMVLNELTQGATDDLSAFGIGIKFAASGTTSTSNTTSDEFDVNLGTTQTTTSQQTYSASITLGDCPFTQSATGGAWSCLAPAAAQLPNVQPFLDTRFGTWMATLPDLAIQPPPPTLTLVPLNSSLVAKGLTPTHFALPNSVSKLRPAVVKPGIPREIAKRRAVSLGLRHPAPLIKAPAGLALPLDPKWRATVFPEVRR